MIPSPWTIVWTVLAPALIAGALLFVTRRDDPTRRRPFLGALAIAAGFAVAYVHLFDAPPFGDRPPTSREWSVWLALLCVVLVPLRALPKYGPALYMASTSVVLTRFALARMFQEHAELGTVAVTVVQLATTLAFYFTWLSLEHLARRRAGPSLAAAFWVATAALAVAQVISGSGALGQLAGAVCATLGAATVFGLLFPRVHLSSGVLACTLLVCASNVGTGLLNELPGLSAACIGLAFLAPWLAEAAFLAQPLEKLGARKRCIATAALAAVPAALAVFLAWQASQERGAV